MQQCDGNPLLFFADNAAVELVLNVASSPVEQNRLLAALPSLDYGMLAKELTECELHAGEVLHAIHSTARHVWFPMSGLISLRAEIAPGTGLEIAMIGRDGVAGIVGIIDAVVTDAAASPLSAIVKISGKALRIDAERFKAACMNSAVLTALLCRPMEALLIQASQSAVCSHCHLLEARLARVLLMTRRCMGVDEFHMTHELLSQALGVRRVGVTKAATSLQRRQLIRYSRGAISIVDVPGLAAAACSCYRHDQDAQPII